MNERLGVRRKTPVLRPGVEKNNGHVLADDAPLQSVQGCLVEGAIPLLQARRAQLALHRHEVEQAQGKVRVRRREGDGLQLVALERAELRRGTHEFLVPLPDESSAISTATAWTRLATKPTSMISSSNECTSVLLTVLGRLGYKGVPRLVAEEAFEYKHAPQCEACS